jgi:hypothetical protein
MPNSWVRYQVSENTVDVINLAAAHMFRHVERGDESVIEVHIGDDRIISIMYIIDKEAYNAAINYVKAATGQIL